MPAPFAVRRANFATISERNFVLKSWSSSVRHLEPYAAMDPDIYALHHQSIEAVLALPTLSAHIAHPPDDPGHILGFVIGEDDPQTIHFAYVAQLWRRNGIGRALVHICCPGFGLRETTYTQPATRHIAKAKRAELKLRWNPYALYASAERALDAAAQSPVHGPPGHAGATQIAP